MQDCILKALLIKSVFSLCIVCISFLWAVWTKVMHAIKKAILTTPQTNFVLHRKKQETRSEDKFLLTFIFRWRAAFCQKGRYACRLWFEADERNLRCHVWVTELFLNLLKKIDTTQILSGNWWTGCQNHRAEAPQNENGACSNSSELQNTQLIALACAHSFCFTCKTVFISAQKFSHFHPSDSLSPILLGGRSKWAAVWGLAAYWGQVTTVYFIKQRKHQVKLMS